MQAQNTATTNRSEAAKKAAATRAANKAKQVGPKGAPLEQTDAPEVTEEQRQAERRQAQADRRAQFAPTEQQNLAAHEQPGQPEQQPEAQQPQQPSEEELKAKAFADAIKALAATMGVDPATVLAPQQPAPAQPAQRDQRQTRNNITRPASNTITGSIWDLADKLSAAKNGQGFAAIAELRADATMKQVNEATLKTQYARWRTYHGLKGRQDAPVQVQQPEQPQRRASDQPAQ